MFSRRKFVKVLGLAGTGVFATSLFAGCGEVTSVAQVTSPGATQIPATSSPTTQITPTSTPEPPSPTPQPTATSTPAPTLTPAPTATPTINATATASAILEVTNKETQELEARVNNFLKMDKAALEDYLAKYQPYVVTGQDILPAPIMTIPGTNVEIYIKPNNNKPYANVGLLYPSQEVTPPSGGKAIISIAASIYLGSKEYPIDNISNINISLGFLGVYFGNGDKRVIAVNLGLIPDKSNPRYNDLVQKTPGNELVAVNGPRRIYSRNSSGAIVPLPDTLAKLKPGRIIKFQLGGSAASAYKIPPEFVSILKPESDQLYQQFIQKNGLSASDGNLYWLLVQRNNETIQAFDTLLKWNVVNSQRVATTVSDNKVVSITSPSATQLNSANATLTLLFDPAMISKKSITPYDAYNRPRIAAIDIYTEDPSL